MNFKNLYLNVRKGWSITRGMNSFCNFLVLNYESAVKRFFFKQKNELVVNYKFQAPIGNITLKQRLNQGSDMFIFSEIFLGQAYDIRLHSTPKYILGLRSQCRICFDLF